MDKDLKKELLRILHELEMKNTSVSSSKVRWAIDKHIADMRKEINEGIN